MKKVVLFLGLCLVSVPALSIIAPPTVYFYDKSCPSDKPFRSSKGECHSCNDLKSLRLSDKENKVDFGICPNREIIRIGEFEEFRSRLKECPKSHPLRNLYGDCVSCEEPKSVPVSSKTDCDVCVNRQTEIWLPKTENYSCYLKKCPKDFPLSDDRDCLPCDSPLWTRDDKNTCGKCANRQYIEIPLYDKIKDILKGETPEGCYLKPGDKGDLFEIKLVDRIRMPMSGNPYYQDFYECDTKKVLQTLPEICARCPNRNYIDGKCIFRECPEGSIRSEEHYYNFCSECDKHMCTLNKDGSEAYCWYPAIKTTKEECHKCPNRFWGILDSEGERCFSCNKNIARPAITSAEECARCPDLSYDPETKLCDKKRELEKINREDFVVDFPKRASLSDLELAPLPGVDE